MITMVSRKVNPAMMRYAGIVSLELLALELINMVLFPANAPDTVFHVLRSVTRFYSLIPSISFLPFLAFSRIAKIIGRSGLVGLIERGSTGVRCLFL